MRGGWWCLVLTGCVGSAPAREIEVATVIARNDEVMIRSRPALVAGRYQRMASNAFDFYRGNLALFRQDWELGRSSRSGFLGVTPPVWGLADPHPENFGILIAADGVAAIEPNDFDSADRVPFLFDVRRLVGGLAVGARLANPQLSTAVLGEAAARSYAATLTALASGAAPQRATASSDPIAADLFRRSQRDLTNRAELLFLTEVKEGQRRFRRGVIDPEEPTQFLADVPPEIVAQVPEALRRVQGAPGFEVLDVVREFGSGVASWARVRLLVLVQGPTEAPGDDVILEVKELPESMVAGWYRPALPASDTPARVESAARRAWFRPDADPRFFATTWLGLPVLVRTESEAFKSVRVRRWEGDRASLTSLTTLAEWTGALLARVHAQSEPETVRAIVTQLERGPDVFAAEQGAFAEAHSAQVLEDFAHFQAALTRLGPTLGITQDPRERAPDLASRLFGDPTP
ncbi:MAG: DUF2252 family protein [Myxococcaceae bacterium]|nr:DUF2252 family protein [Myxococcaceae bacterium]